MNPQKTGSQSPDLSAVGPPVMQTRTSQPLQCHCERIGGEISGPFLADKSRHAFDFSFQQERMTGLLYQRVARDAVAGSSWHPMQCIAGICDD